MRTNALALLVLGLPALAQFGPASSAGTRASSAAASSRAAVSTTSTTPTSTLPSGVPPPPTESVGCELHIDHYHCEGPATALAASGTVSGIPPPPTESVGCELHIDHYHCEGAAPGYEASAEESSGECIIHVGHTHGDCSASDLACGAVLNESFNMGLHIAALFVVLIGSALGVFLPIISGWLKKPATGDGASDRTLFESTAMGKGAGLWGNVFFVARHFGTGIIISTAFIHLLFHGIVMFANECIGTLAYESTAPAISMAAAFITFLFDFLGARFLHGKNDNTGSPASRAEKNLPGADSPPIGEQERRTADCCHIDEAFTHEQNWQVTLLEAGIIFHSIMIGVTLGAGTGNGWTTLFIVIVFHQFFEGLALGARIALLQWITKLRAVVMALAFTIITPIGIAIGIGVRKSFSQNGKASLLSVGILNSISAGILLYTAFKLLSSDFTDGPLRSARPLRVFVALFSLVAGLIAMSVLGKWA